MKELSPEKTRILELKGHVLIRGGPGSGKTTIAVLKADSHARRRLLSEDQRVLFLSFARATVARVRQLAGELASEAGWSALEINTYHGFAWNLLRSHGYLLNGKRRLRLLPPPDASARFAELPDRAAELTEMRRLFHEEGVVHFDLFAELAGQLLHGSAALRRIVSSAYPIVVLDEFQDTNADEWRMIQPLGIDSRLVALADADQRIYEFRGADPKRIDEFLTTYEPATFDFGGENNRSYGTDIVTFGNDLLTGGNRGKDYTSVTCINYRVRRETGIHLDLKLQVFQALRRLQEAQGRDWSLAVLVPTNHLMMDVSDYLGREHTLKGGRTLGAIGHDVAFDASGPSLAAVVIASALEAGDSGEIASRIIGTLRDHIRGRRGNSRPSRQQLETAIFLEQYDLGARVRGSARRLLIDECVRIADLVATHGHSGNVEDDWLAVRKLFQESPCPPLAGVAEDAKYLRFLHRGSALRSRLAEQWRTDGRYSDASAAVRDALLQEHFAGSVSSWKGVHVMTIHKSKGKEFDEVIVYEGVHRDRIVAPNAVPEEVSKARRNLRVAVSRARQRATILTPKSRPCPLL